MIRKYSRGEYMPPFGAEKLEVQPTDEERRLSERRRALEESLFERMLKSARDIVPLSRVRPLVNTYGQSEIGSYPDPDQPVDEESDENRVQLVEAKVETGINTRDFVTMYTRRMPEEGGVDTEWTAQLTLQKVDETATMYDRADPNKRWENREAVEILRAASDTMSILEQQSAVA
jgi:hypothetical protein